MKIIDVSAAQYKEHFSKPLHVFNSVSFSELNKDKCDGLHYLLFEDTKIIFGLVLGEKGNSLCSPFSAPFGGFETNKARKLEYMEDALALLKEYGTEKNRKIFITLPPSVYDQSQVSKWFNVFSMSGAQLVYTELDYYFDLSHFSEYENHIGKNARKNLHNALNNNLSFIKLNSNDDKDVSRTYDVIRRNREEHDYLLRMSLQNVLDTVKIVDADFFIVTNENIDIAAAQVFRVSEDIAQVIYWGDLKDYAGLRTMNYLSYMVFKYYHDMKFRILDVGPSTVEGVPNYGLCDFKENIGCSICPRFSFEIESI